MGLGLAKDPAFVAVFRLNAGWSRSEFESVNKWLKAIRRRGDSYSTKHSYLKCLELFVRRSKVGPDELVAMSGGKAAAVIQEFCDRYAENKQLRTAHIYLNYLRSFLKHNGRRDVELEEYSWRRSRRPERIPTRDELYKMAEISDLRDRAVLLCDFHSGLRNATLRALTFGDLKDQLEAGKEIICVRVTAQLKERVPAACKENVEHLTFFGRKATEALRLYLEERERRRGPIGQDEPLFISASNVPHSKARSQPITEDALQRLIKRAARKAGIKEWRQMRFHSLRKTFRSVLDAGFKSGGQLAEDDKEFLMGHALPSQRAPYHDANMNTLLERYGKLDWGGEPLTLEREEEVRSLRERVTRLEAVYSEKMKIKERI